MADGAFIYPYLLGGTMEVVDDTSENPFENAINDVPMSAICRNIEIDLRDMLGETDLPKRIQAVENILL